MIDGCYILDTSAILILHREINRGYYSSDVLSRIEQAIRDGRIWIPPQVIEELKVKEDTSFKWAREHYDKHPRNKDFNAEIQELQSEVKGLLIRTPQIRNQLKGADLYLIGWAKVLKKLRSVEAVVVTQEGTSAVVPTQEETPAAIANPEVGKSNKNIPEACHKEGVPCKNLTGMFAELGWKFLNKAP